jgi:hypothetical protein
MYVSCSSVGRELLYTQANTDKTSVNMDLNSAPSILGPFNKHSTLYFLVFVSFASR